MAAVDAAATNMEKKNRPFGRFFFYGPMIPRDKQDTALAWLGALCFFLSTIEYMIPKPLPFLRLGITNLPVMLAIDLLPLPAWTLLIFIKILGQGLLGGTLFSYICVFSAAGSLASGFVMLGLKKLLKRRVSYVGISVAGAFASNLAQLTLARFWIFGESAWYIAPPFIGIGIVTGIILGVFANAFAAKSRWYADLGAGNILLTRIARPDAPGINPPGIAMVIRLCVGFSLLVVLFFANDLRIQALITAIGGLLLIVDRSKIRPVPALMMTASVIAFNLLVPFGKILAEPFGVPITEGALVSGIKKALTVEGMLFVSRWMLSQGIRLPGKAGKIIADSFSILRDLAARRKSVVRDDIIGSIDRIMYGRD
jgi:uncharacterized membrane protein